MALLPSIAAFGTMAVMSSNFPRNATVFDVSSIRDLSNATSARNFTCSTCSLIFFFVYMASRIFRFSERLMVWVGRLILLIGAFGISAVMVCLYFSLDEYIIEGLSILYCQFARARLAMSITQMKTNSKHSNYCQAKSCTRLNFVLLLLEVFETTIGTTICLIVISTGINDPMPYLLIVYITLVFVSLFTLVTEIVPIRRPDPPPVERLRPIRHNPRIANEDEDNDNAVPMERIRMVNPIADYFQ
ncbi:hypothetical protein GCK72_014807 [Caenorhabditis remanei]|uniref:Uncharacterized protein n=1 Tax=Caenorhabditis remanei TaxID=31234 RepID=A0A6A5GUY5_CAERE|nr:hypothetical protein GCK72_014807 [Caenorhabditis remanei]KAF1758349.1 hypothetical protein GCK72_014807 [Caenorhabditis remanei]